MDAPKMDNIPLEIKTRIESLATKKMSLQDLFIIYGESLGCAATGEDPTHAAKENIVSRLDELRDRLCGSDFTKTILKDKIANKATAYIALQIAEKLIQTKFCCIDIAPLVVLLAELGLKKLCEDDAWTL